MCVCVWFGLIFTFNSISNFLGYLMPKPPLLNKGTIQPITGW